MTSQPDTIKFDLDAKTLPKEIDEAAIASGGYPYGKRMKRRAYENELLDLQIELMKLQRWVAEEGKRVVMVFEGRDSAGKGSAIKRFMEHMNPRHARAVALSKPTEAERGQWYFQRYITHLPTAGDMVLFDRSWYNRAGVERVMGFCTQTELADFMREAPQFEGMLVRDDIHLFKFFLTIGREMQMKRFHARRHDPLKQWKLSPIDLQAVARYDDYTIAKEDMFRSTHTATTPWTVIRANDKRRTRLEAIRVVLSALDYKGKDHKAVGEIDPKLVGSSDEFFYSS